MKTPAFHINLAGFDITVTQTGADKFTVRYGLQEETGLSYERAARELGECIFHALVNEGKLE